MITDSMNLTKNRFRKWLSYAIILFIFYPKRDVTGSQWISKEELEKMVVEPLTDFEVGPYFLIK